MATLFDELQKKLANPEGPAPTAAQGGVLGALKAKTGKATTGSGPSASNVGEQGALGTVAATMGQTRLTGQIQGQQVAQAAQAQQAQVDTAKADMASQRAQANQTRAATTAAANEQRAGAQDMALGQVAFDESQKVEALNASADRSFRELAAEMKVNTDNIFREFAREEKSLAFRKDAAEIEQIGFMLALRDKAYIDELNRVATERDLQDKLNYQDEMTRLVLGDELERLMDDIGFKRALSANQREWDVYLANMDVETATALAAATMRDEGRSQMISGVGDTAKAGIDAYYKVGSGKPAGNKPTYEQMQENIIQEKNIQNDSGIQDYAGPSNYEAIT